jgi:hypothetical protein
VWNLTSKIPHCHICQKNPMMKQNLKHIVIDYEELCQILVVVVYSESCFSFFLVFVFAFVFVSVFVFVFGIRYTSLYRQISQ